MDQHKILAMKTIQLTITALLMASASYSQNLEKRLDSLFQGHVNNGEIHGCLVTIIQDEKVIMNKPYGFMDLENKRAMETDAVFRIASLTKLLTAASAMKLYDEGKFLLDEPVKKYIPEFANLRVIAPGYTTIDSVRTVPLERDVTIRDLLRHTAGFGYGGSDVVGKLYVRNIRYSDSMTLKQFVQGIVKAPLKYQPGSRWEYSFANDILGYLIEVIAGKPLDEYMDEAIFKPMDMNHTGFYVKPDDVKHLCNFYEYSGNKLILKESSANTRITQRPAFISGGGGGISTADDYSKFCQMLLNYGEYNGKRILSRQSVELMISDQIEPIKDRGFEVTGFGFGVGVLPGKNCGATKDIHWAGSPYNNTYVVDFEKKSIAILLMQNGPWEHLGLMDQFKEIVSEEL
mgnify:CR=1 FL=1